MLYSVEIKTKLITALNVTKNQLNQNVDALVLEP